MSYELVAMSESGDTYVIRRPVGDLWLIVPEGGRGGGSIDDAGLARAIIQAGFRLVGEKFANLTALGQRVNELACTSELRPVETSIADVEMFLPTLREDASDPTLWASVHSEALFYLQVPGVAERPDLVRALTSLLCAIDRQSTASAAETSTDIGKQRWAALAA